LWEGGGGDPFAPGCLEREEVSGARIRTSVKAKDKHQKRDEQKVG